MTKYILNVVDNEDEYIYFSLTFNTEQECLNVKELIREFDDKWYEAWLKDEADGINTDDYCADLKRYLIQNNIKVDTDVKHMSVRVR